MTELFHTFETLNRPRGSRLVRAFGGSFVLHALFISCVIFVPTVRSMFHIAGIFADADYVNEDYRRIRITERAQIINIAADGRFHYPPGYFSKSALTPLDTQPVAEAKPKPTPAPVKPPKPKPTPKPSPQPSALPTPEPTPAIAQNNQSGAGDPPPSPTPEDQKKAEQDLEKVATETKTKRFPKINSKPFKDLLAKGKELKDKGELDLNGTIRMTIEADRNEDGTLSHVVVTPVATSDKNMKVLAMEFVQALSASRVLIALEGTRHLRMKLSLDDQAIVVSAVTEAESEERAAEMARGYGGMLFIERWRRSGKDEAAIFKNTNISAQGKLVTVKFQMSRKAAGEMLAKQVPAS